MSDREPRIYLLPTMMTAGNILAGFVAILQIFQGRNGEVIEHYHWAVLAILVACLFDVLDGRVARLGGQESPFGRELDSLPKDVLLGQELAVGIVRDEVDLIHIGHAGAATERQPKTATQDLFRQRLRRELA